jgi:hypothetical protein
VRTLVFKHSLHNGGFLITASHTLMTSLSFSQGSVKLETKVDVVEIVVAVGFCCENREGDRVCQVEAVIYAFILEFAVS